MLRCGRARPMEVHVVCDEEDEWEELCCLALRVLGVVFASTLLAWSITRGVIWLGLLAMVFGLALLCFHMWDGSHSNNPSLVQNAPCQLSLRVFRETFMEIKESLGWRFPYAVPRSSYSNESCETLHGIRINV